MGMDDTRMDLSQLQEGSGRSVPSTPLSLSAPGNLLQYYLVGNTKDQRLNEWVKISFDRLYLSEMQ